MERKDEQIKRKSRNTENRDVYANKIVVGRYTYRILNPKMTTIAKPVVSIKHFFGEIFGKRILFQLVAGRWLIVVVTVSHAV